MPAKTSKQTSRVTPLPEESIKAWVCRYKALFNKEPDNAFMRNTPWPRMSLVTDAQMNVSRVLQSALIALKEADPDGDTYYWPGRSQIWFSSEADIVMLKLRMNP